MKKTKLILSILFLIISQLTDAQAQEFLPKKWGIEAELAQPFIPTVNIWRIQATRTLTDPARKMQGDLILGAYIRPNVEHDVVEKINEYMVAIGYRNYFWKGLHLEAKANLGYAWGTRNLIDGKDYETMTFFYETNLGYRLRLPETKKSRFYLIPQLGVIGNGRGKNTVNIGPRGGKTDVFFQGGILAGINF